MSRLETRIKVKVKVKVCIQLVVFVTLNDARSANIKFVIVSVFVINEAGTVVKNVAIKKIVISLSLITVFVKIHTPRVVSNVRLCIVNVQFTSPICKNVNVKQSHYSP
jgi:hypothetical protein